MIFGVVKYQDAAFTSDDIEFLTQIANQVALRWRMHLPLERFES